MTKGKSGCLLSYTTACKLDLIKFTVNTVCDGKWQPKNDFEKKIIEKYAVRFDGIGKLKNYKSKLHIDKSIKPVAVPHRRISFHLQEKVEGELKYLEDNDITEKEETMPTPWVSAIVTPPKPNNPDKVRLKCQFGQTICVDMRSVINDYSTLTKPLRELTMKNKPWEWKTEHQEAFEKLKKILTSDIVMSYFDINKKTELLVDASPVGCGAVLTII